MILPGKLRDDFGYDYLNSLTGVDYIAENKMEVVYHASRTTGGAGVVFKVQVPRDNPVVPSLTGIYRGAEFQEREAYDLLGIRFTKHPDLRRILTWEGFAGHPLQKDWKEPFFEEEVKPFKSRWPDPAPWCARKMKTHLAIISNIRRALTTRKNGSSRAMKQFTKPCGAYMGRSRIWKPTA